MLAANSRISERDIVVEIHWRFVAGCRSAVLRRARLLLAAAELVTALWLLRLAPTALAAGRLTGRCAAALTAAQHLHGAADVNHDLGGVAILAALILPFTGLQPSM